MTGPGEAVRPLAGLAAGPAVAEDGEDDAGAAGLTAATGSRMSRIGKDM